MQKTVRRHTALTVVLVGLTMLPSVIGSGQAYSRAVEDWGARTYEACMTRRLKDSELEADINHWVVTVRMTQERQPEIQISLRTTSDNGSVTARVARAQGEGILYQLMDLKGKQPETKDDALCGSVRLESWTATSGQVPALTQIVQRLVALRINPIPESGLATPSVRVEVWGKHGTATVNYDVVGTPNEGPFSYLGKYSDSSRSLVDWAKALRHLMEAGHESPSARLAH